MAAANVNYGPMTEAELPAVCRAVGLAFATPPDKIQEWLRSGGLEQMRVLRAKDRPAACLLRIPMAQYFGGLSVAMTGIAGVAVAPEDRGSGHALEMMRACIREIAAEGVPLSGLYASTQPLYRQVGYEQAGHCFRIKLPVVALGVRERTMTLRPITETDEVAVKACYAEFASRFDGMLDRTIYAWRRVKRWRDVDYQGWAVVGERDQMEGYVYLSQQRKDTGKQDLSISDIAFTSARAGRRLLGFLGDFATMGEDAIMSQTGPIHPLLSLLPTQKYVVERREYWMTRITSLQKAFESRGYPIGLNASIALHVRDELVPQNDGTFTLTIENGKAQLTSGGRGAGIRASIGGLAPLFSGFYSARQAELAGLIACDPAAHQAAASIFPGGCPWMADFF